MEAATVAASESARRKSRRINALVGSSDTNAPMGLVSSCPTRLGSDVTSMSP